MAELDPIFAIEAEAFAGIIDELDYFQVLEIDQTANPAAIKQAYFHKSRVYHPDQYYGQPEGPVKTAISKIYKRVNEAFMVLSNDRKRPKYVSDVNGPFRARKLRYSEEAEEELRRAKDQEQGTTPHGRKTFRQGMVDMEAGRFAQALQNFRMALTFEPQNVLFKQKVEEAARLAAPPK